MSISLMEHARGDLRKIHDHLHLANPEAATGTVQRILDAIDRLDSFPIIGRPGHLPGTREFSVAGLPISCIYRCLLYTSDAADE